LHRLAHGTSHARPNASANRISNSEPHVCANNIALVIADTNDGMHVNHDRRCAPGAMFLFKRVLLVRVELKHWRTRHVLPVRERSVPGHLWAMRRVSYESTNILSYIHNDVAHGDPNSRSLD